MSGIQKNILLKNYTTFKIGGKAKYFFVAKEKKDLILAIKLAKKLKLPFFVLGGGSNLLISDKGFEGLVIKIIFSKFYFQDSKIFAEAGTPLSLLVNETLKKNISGFEWAVGIPGTLGGAINGNAGAFGKSMKDAVKEVEALDVKSMRFKRFNLKDCKFSYRESAFKKKKNLIIVSAVLGLRRGKKKQIENKIREYLEYKKETQPLSFPSAGSIFKNPRGFSSSSFTAARMIEECGLKGKKAGDAKISEKHANFIVNLGEATAKDVKKLINLAQKSVKKKFKVVLEEEVQIF